MHCIIPKLNSVIYNNKFMATQLFAAKRIEHTHTKFNNTPQMNQTNISLFAIFCCIFTACRSTYKNRISTEKYKWLI